EAQRVVRVNDDRMRRNVGIALRLLATCMPSISDQVLPPSTAPAYMMFAFVGSMTRARAPADVAGAEIRPRAEHARRTAACDIRCDVVGLALFVCAARGRRSRFGFGRRERLCGRRILLHLFRLSNAWK